MMERIELKYGCNPNQGNASVEIDSKLPIQLLNGRVGYINLLDGLNGYQLVKELDEATGLPSATSFKHVSPAGVAVAKELSDRDRKAYFIPQSMEISPMASAYARARGADRMSSFGDFIALSRECDESTAILISKEVSDGIICPGYSAKALEILKAKRGGSYTVLSIDPNYVPAKEETRTLYGMTFKQDHNDFKVTDDTFLDIVTQRKEIPQDIKLDMTIALIALKYTQSNSVVYSFNGQTIGIGAGQQSRIHCTRIAGDKADMWLLKHSDKVLSLPFRKGLSRNEKDNVIEQYLLQNPEIDVCAKWQDYFSYPVEPMDESERDEILSCAKGITLASDAFFPFRDNIDRARRSGVGFIVQPGGSMRDDDVIKACDEHSMVMVFTHNRLFHH